MDKMIRVYQCEDTVDGILSAIYDAGISGYGHEYIRIEPQSPGYTTNRTLFSEYITVQTDSGKKDSVIKAVRSKISWKAYAFMMNALASDFSDRGDVVYRFVAYGFTMGKQVCEALQLPCVKRIFAINRAVQNEAHYFNEFLRFQEVAQEPSLLLGVIEPRHHVIPNLMQHFEERFISEWFIIYDKTHQEAAFHQADGSWELRLLTGQEAKKLEELTEKQEEYADLWKTFFDHIAIVERKNQKLQTNMMPLHYRKYMTEFH